MMKIAIAILAASTLASVAWAEDAAAPSVQVTTVPARSGSLPETVIAYGSVEPAPDGSVNISLLRAGQVLAVHVSPGTLVRKGDPLIEFGADPAALASYDQAVSALAAAREERARAADLLKQQLATRAQLSQADKTVNDAKSALTALDRSGGGQPSESIRAPFDGIVMSLAVGPGDRLQPSAPLLQLARADRLEVVGGVDPAERSKLKVGAIAHLEPLDAAGTALDGTVTSVAGLIDAKTRQVEVRIKPTTAGLAMPGGGYRMRIETGRWDGWLVPREAVLSDNTGGHLFQVDGSTAKSVPVKVEGEAGNTVVVAGALDPAQAVVASGAYQLSDGAAVRIEDGGGRKSVAP